MMGWYSVFLVVLLLGTAYHMVKRTQVRMALLALTTGMLLVHLNSQGWAGPLLATVMYGLGWALQAISIVLGILHIKSISENTGAQSKT
jgi:hypothetical protein